MAKRKRKRAISSALQTVGQVASALSNARPAAPIRTLDELNLPFGVSFEQGQAVRQQAALVDAQRQQEFLGQQELDQRAQESAQQIALQRRGLRQQKKATTAAAGREERRITQEGERIDLTREGLELDRAAGTRAEQSQQFGQELAVREQEFREGAPARDVALASEKARLEQQSPEYLARVKLIEAQTDTALFNLEELQNPNPSIPIDEAIKMRDSFVNLINSDGLMDAGQVKAEVDAYLEIQADAGVFNKATLVGLGVSGGEADARAQYFAQQEGEVRLLQEGRELPKEIAESTKVADRPEVQSAGIQENISRIETYLDAGGTIEDASNAGLQPQQVTNIIGVRIAEYMQKNPDATNEDIKRDLGFQAWKEWRRITATNIGTLFKKFSAYVIDAAATAGETGQFVGTTAPRR